VSYCNEEKGTVVLRKVDKERRRRSLAGLAQYKITTLRVICKNHGSMPFCRVCRPSRHDTPATVPTHSCALWRL